VQTYTVRVGAPRDNHPPVIVSTPETNIAAGTPEFNYTVRAVDADGDRLHYKLLDGPEGLTFDAATHEVSWDPRGGALNFNNEHTLESVDEEWMAFENFTIEGWYRFDAQAGRVQQLFDKGGRISLELNQNSLLAIIRNDATGIFLGAGFTPVLGSWHHIAIVFDDAANRFSMVIDGVEAAVVNPSFSMTYGAEPFQFGNTGRRNMMQGGIDEVRMWDIARTPAQIAADMTRYLAGNETGLVTYLRFDETRGDVAFDATGNSHNFVLGELDAFPPERIVGLTFERDEDVSLQVRDARGATDIQNFTLHTTFNSPATITGFVFNDTSGDGFQQLPDEGPLAGRVVFIDANHNGLRDSDERSATTSADGAYSFTFLAAGTYRVALEGIVARTTTGPIGGAIDAVVTAGGSANQPFGSQAIANLIDRAPSFTSIPPAIGQADDLYRYNPVVFSPDGRPVEFSLSLAPVGMAIDPATGVIVWRPELDQTPSQRVVVRVRDDRGLVALQDFTITVEPANSGPQIVSIAPIGPAGVGLPFQYDVRAIDADGNSLTFTLEDGPASASIDSATGRLTYMPQPGDVLPPDEDWTFRVSVIDGHGGRAEQIFHLAVEVSPANHLPVIDSLPRTAVRFGDTYRYEMAAHDTDGDPLSYSLDLGPTGMTLSPEGVVTWIPTDLQLGEQAVRILVADGRGGIVPQDFTIEVRTQASNGAPVIVSRPNASAIVGEAFEYRASAADPDHDPVRFELRSGPIGMAIDATTGVLRWSPRGDQLGPNGATIVAIDNFGGEGTQSFVVTVLGIGVPPLVTSRPPTEGVVGVTYTYALAVGAAAGDSLTYSLPVFPAGMTIDPISGIISWTPSGAQLGPQEVEVRVANARGSASQGFEIVVTAGVANRPPQITTLPPSLGAVGALFSYDVNVFDPEGETPTFELRQFPAGMTIDPQSGVLQWTPAVNQVGEFVVTVAALDSLGGAGLQSFRVTIAAANTAPRITSTAPTQGTAGALYAYEVLATDDQFDPLFYSLDAGPVGMTIDDRGRIQWLSFASDLGDHDVTVRIIDARGAATTQSFTIQSFTIHLTADIQAPRLSILFDKGAGYSGEVVNLQVRASDNVGVTLVSLTANGGQVPLDFLACGRITLAGNVLGDWIDLVATARDAAGNLGTTTARLRVIPSVGEGIPEAPSISIASPAENGVVTTFTEVIGTANALDFASYKLLIKPADGAIFTVIASSTTAVVNGQLGTIDPTLLQNDSYVLRLEVYDSIGAVTFVEQIVNISGELKLGNFRLSFTDMAIPVSGIPITISRTYDTLQAGRSSELGFGWRMEFRNVDLRTSIPKTGFEQYGIYSSFVPGTRVYITLPGGKREGFTFTPQIRSLFDLTIATPFFTPDAGVTNRLSVQNTTLIVRDGELVSGGGQAYNPAAEEFGGGFTLITKEGVSYRIDGRTGLLQTVTDRNNQTLTFNESGVQSSAGPALRFDRDAAGRIIGIIDPAGKSLHYAYSPSGKIKVSGTFS